MDRLKVIGYSNCECGAMTLKFANGATSSMSSKTYKKIRAKVDMGNAEFYGKMHCCDHCVNHYGIDLCSCGSGEPVNKCSCGSNEPMEEFGVYFDTFQKIIENFS